MDGLLGQHRDRVARNGAWSLNSRAATSAKWYKSSRTGSKPALRRPRPSACCAVASAGFVAPASSALRPVPRSGWAPVVCTDPERACIAFHPFALLRRGGQDSLDSPWASVANGVAPPPRSPHAVIRYPESKGVGRTCWIPALRAGGFERRRGFRPFHLVCGNPVATAPAVREGGANHAVDKGIDRGLSCTYTLLD